MSVYLPDQNTKLEFYPSQYTPEQIEASIGKGPIIQNGTWWVWNVETGAYQDTGIYATIAPGSVTTDMLSDSSVTWPKLAPEARKSNPNLIDNAYFIGGGSQRGGGQFPINQRGLTEYTVNGYGIDRWYSLSSVKFMLQSDGLYFPSDTVNAGLAQKIEGFRDLSLTPLTFSLLVPSLTGTITVAYFYYDTSYRQVVLGAISSPGCHAFSFVPPDPSDKLYFGVRFYAATNTTTSYKVSAAKLELGPNQTLAHESAGGWILNDPAPNFALELTKCLEHQNIGPNCAQYLSVFMGNNPAVYCFLSTPVPLRAKPTLYGEPIVRKVSDTVAVSNASIAVFAVMRGGVQLRITGVSEPVYLEGSDWGVDCNL